jgi:hypothetical protein
MRPQAAAFSYLAGGGKAASSARAGKKSSAKASKARAKIK